MEANSLLNYKSIVGRVIKTNINATFVDVEKYGEFEFDFKWVGGILAANNKIYGITNGCTNVLEIDPLTNQISVFGKLSEGAFKWTGGCLYKDGCIYGFPRSANTLLKINPQNKTVQEIPLGTNYTGIDHHYSGVLYDDKVYLAPRREKHILIIDLNTMMSKKLGETVIGNYIYCGAIMHPNGLIYFLPQTYSRVMVLNPVTEQVSFIGNEISPICFGVSIMPDGCMYGFCDNGMLKINPNNEEVKTICPTTTTGENVSGLYGTKMAPNGRLYGVPGASLYIYEFNPDTETVSIVASIDEGKFNEAKCAGGILAPNGSVWLIPAKGKYVYKLNFNGINEPMPESILRSVYFSNY